MPFIQEVFALAQIFDNEVKCIPSVLEFLQAQKEDKKCWQAAKPGGLLDSNFTIDESEIILRILQRNGAIQRLLS